MQRQLGSVLGAVAAVLLLGGAAASAECTIEMRQAAGEYYRVIVCDESDAAIEDAMAKALESCITSTGEWNTACQEAVVESFRLRREAMLRRALKEGASIRAAAELYGYTEDEVERFLMADSLTDQGFGESEKSSATALQVEQDLEAVKAIARQQLQIQ